MQAVILTAYKNLEEVFFLYTALDEMDKMIGTEDPAGRDINRC